MDLAMQIGAALVEALKGFSLVERQIVMIGQKVDDSCALEFVRLRRQLVMSFATLGNALENDPWLKDKPDLLQQGLRLFSAFRAQNSINQANWPVVRAKDNLADYQVAARPVGVSSRDFWQWVDRELGYRR